MEEQKIKPDPCRKPASSVSVNSHDASLGYIELNPAAHRSMTMLPPTVYGSNPASLLVAFLAVSVATLVSNKKFLQKLKTIINAVKSRQQLDELVAPNNEKHDNLPRVSGIFIHPIKSLRAVSLSETKFDEHGLKADRRLMIVRPIPRSASSHSAEENKATHRFFTQRQSPSLATIEASEPVEIAASGGDGGRDGVKKLIIKLSSSLLPNDDHVMINVHPDFTSKLPIRYQAGLWSDTVEVADLGDEAAAFVAKIISRDDELYKDVRVVVILKSTVRAVNELYCPDAARVGMLANLPQGGLTDGFPILVTTQASLDELNRRLKEKGKDQLPMSRFRPNIVISNTSKPFEEDNWKAIQIGIGPKATILHITKGCPRCKQSCTDQLTGERGEEPLETLSDFRALGTSEEDVYFGQNAVVNGYWWANNLNERVVNVGDPVFVLTRGPPTWDSDEVKAE